MGFWIRKGKKILLGQSDILMEFVLYQCCFPDLEGYAMLGRRASLLCGYTHWMFRADIVSSLYIAIRLF